MKLINRYFLLISLMIGSLLAGGCQSSPSKLPTFSSTEGGKAAETADSSPEMKSSANRETVRDILLPSADATLTYGTDSLYMDASHLEDGYLMIEYNGSADKVKLQITNPDGTVYSYPVAVGKLRSFPLTGGSGNYQVALLEHAYDDLYAVSFTQNITVNLTDEFRPFLFPNQYSWYDGDSQSVALGISLSQQSSDDLDYVEQVYLWVIENITYDNDKAASVATNYIPDISDTLSSKKGICFDYAALMVSMLRSQGLPTKLEVGYSGQIYHAWISVYLEEHGWVDSIIEFDGQSWTLMDPTLAAGNHRNEVKKYIDDSNNYTVKYHY